MLDVAPIRGLIFDLDGTLIDSALDFDAMRAEMGLPSGRPLLEAIAALAPDRASDCWQILERHELVGATQARPMPGVIAMLDRLDALGIRTAVLTRNSRAMAQMSMACLGRGFDAVMSRDEPPVKPHPAAIWRICDGWKLARRQVAMVGDFHFDVEAGRRAGVRTVLYGAGAEAVLANASCAPRPELLLSSFEELDALTAWMLQPT